MDSFCRKTQPPIVLDRAPWETAFHARSYLIEEGSQGQHLWADEASGPGKGRSCAAM